MDVNLDLCNSLIKWLNTFRIDAPHGNVQEISDGVAMAQALNQIAPEWFDKSFMSKIKSDAGTSWRLKVSNLKKISEHIYDYYQECLNQQLGNFSRPDVSRIGENCDRVETGRLLQLILGCAVNCTKKEAHINVIMGMETSVQQIIMQAIQELEDSSQASIGPTEDTHMTKLNAELDRVSEERDQMAQRCHELDLQVSFLQDEKASLTQELSRLQNRMQETESPANVAVSSSKYGLLKREYDILKEEMFKVESARDDSRVKLEAQEKIIAELQSRNDELQVAAEEARQLKDEMDVLRETADKVEKCEATVESYKRKLEELSDLKRQNKILEDKNANYVSSIEELEKEVKRQGAWKSQAETYKKQVGELHQKVSDETKKADKFAFESNKLSEKLAAVTREKERLIAERDLLKEANEELTCQVSARPNGDESSAHELQPELRERLARLTQENRQLQLLQKEAEQLTVVQALLDASNSRIETLTSESRSANQRILELESQLEESQFRNQEGGEEETTLLRKEIAQLRGQIRTLTSETENLRAKVEQQDEQSEELRRKNTQLKEALQRKETELAEAEEKKKKCVEKAKIVVSSLEPKQPELMALRNQLLKDSESQRLEQNHNLLTEMRLIQNNYHRLTGKKQRESADQRMAALSAATFLARQRAPVPRKLPNK